MNSLRTRAQSQTLRENTKALHAQCEQVRCESRDIIERIRISVVQSRAAVARSRARRASSMPAAA
jgi:hypothetical protein